MFDRCDIARTDTQRVASRAATLSCNSKYAIGLSALLLSGLMIDCANAADPALEPSARTTQGDSPDTWIPKLQIGTEDFYIRFYGQLNKGLLVYDDGGQTQSYFPVDNDASSTRFGLKAFRRYDDGWSIGGTAEAEWNPYSTSTVNQNTFGNVDWGTALLRKAEIYIDNSATGRLWAGQGSMASDGTAEVDLSGTGWATGYSSVADIAGAQIYRLAGGTLSGIQVGKTFKNFDGLSRKFRVRYDTPSLNGIVLGASVGQQVVPDNTGETVWDVAAKYKKSVGDYKVSGAVAYSRNSDDKIGTVDGSISFLHLPTGLNATFAGAAEFRPDRDVHYVYGKLGRQADYFDFGRTAFSIDAYFGRQIKTAGSESVSFGFQAAQSVDYWQTDFYLGIQSYDYDDGAGDYKTGLATIAGARVKF